MKRRKLLKNAIAIPSVLMGTKALCEERTVVDVNKLTVEYVAEGFKIEPHSLQDIVEVDLNRIDMDWTVLIDRYRGTMVFLETHQCNELRECSEIQTQERYNGDLVIRLK